MAKYGLLTILVFGRGFFRGILFGDWMRLLWRDRFRVPFSYWPRLFLISMTSILNSFLHKIELICYGSKIRKAQYAPPVFVLGVPRSGTTHLFNLLAKDERFGYPNLIQVYNPHTFLCAEWLLAPVVDLAMPPDRGIDNMESGSKAPEEDEYALLNLTLLSFLLSGTFPRLAYRYDRYRTFRRANEVEITKWKKGLKYFVKKMAYKVGGKPLVLKSPMHTGRIRMILDVFPDAKFVLIHRDPYEVFQSYVKMLRHFNMQFNFQEFDEGDGLADFTLQLFKEINDAFFEDRKLIPKGNYCEVGYEELSKDPMAQMKRIYESLSLPDFSFVEPRLREYLGSISDYKKSKLSGLSDSLKTRIATEWRQSFEEWNYPTLRDQKEGGTSPKAGD